LIIDFKEDYDRAKKRTEEKVTDWKKYREKWLGNLWGEINADANASKPEVNYIKTNVEQLVAQLQLKNPEISVQPVESSDVETAAALAAIVSNIYQRKKVSQEFTLATRDMILYGVGYVGIVWNSLDDMGVGNIRANAISPFNLFLDPIATRVRDAGYAHIKSLQSPVEVYTKYGVELDESATDDFTGQKGVEIRESWYKPSTLFPRGRHIIWTDTQTLLEEDNPYIFGQIPIVDIIGEGLSTGDIGSLVKDLSGIQDVFQKTIGFIFDNLRLTNNNQYVTDDESVPSTMPSAPGFIQHVNPESKFDVIQTQPVSSGWFNLASMAQAMFPDISGNREVNAGASSQGITAASAIVALQEAGRTRKEVRADNIAQAVSEWGLYAVSMIGQYYDIARCQRILGEMTPQSLSMFLSDPTAYMYDVEVMYAEALPEDKASRLNIVMQLVNAKILTPSQAFTIVGDKTLLAAVNASQAEIQQQMAQAAAQQMGAAGMAAPQGGAIGQ
jgi:hypothetical protein